MQLQNRTKKMYQDRQTTHLFTRARTFEIYYSASILFFLFSQFLFSLSYCSWGFVLWKKNREVLFWRKSDMEQIKALTSHTWLSDSKTPCYDTTVPWQALHGHTWQSVAVSSCHGFERSYLSICHGPPPPPPPPTPLDLTTLSNLLKNKTYFEQDVVSWTFVLPTFNSEAFLTVKFDEEKKRKKKSAWSRKGRRTWSLLLAIRLPHRLHCTDEVQKGRNSVRHRCLQFNSSFFPGLILLQTWRKLRVCE